MPKTTPANEAGAFDPGVGDRLETGGRQSTVTTRRGASLVNDTNLIDGLMSA